MENNIVTFSLYSPDGDQGFPGELITSVRCELTNDNMFKMDFNAKSNKKTIINLTNHAYFNLAGESTGFKGLYEHTLQVNADQITETNDDQLPTGNVEIFSTGIFFINNFIFRWFY